MVHSTMEMLWGQSFRILRRHPSASMIIAVNDYYGNEVINKQGGEHQKRSAAYVGGQPKKCISRKRMTFYRYKRTQQFFPDLFRKYLMAKLQSGVNFSAKDLSSKEMSKIIVILHVMTERDIR